MHYILERSSSICVSVVCLYYVVKLLMRKPFDSLISDKRRSLDYERESVFKCKKCRMRYENEDLMIKHLKHNCQNEIKPSYNVDYAHFMEPLVSIRSTSVTDTDSTKYQCHFCDFSTAHKFSWQRHVKKMHPWYLICVIHITWPHCWLYHNLENEIEYVFVYPALPR